MVDLARARMARHLLGDPLFSDLISDLTGLQLTRIIDSDPEDRQVRDDAYWTIRALRLMQGQLEAYAGEEAHLRSREETAQMMGDGGLE